MDLHALSACVLASSFGCRHFVDGRPAHRRCPSYRVDNTSRRIVALQRACLHRAGHWAMAMVNRSLPAVTTSLGLLVTPAFGMISAAVILSERLEPSLIVALALIVGGIALGTVGDIRAARTTVPAKL